MDLHVPTRHVILLITLVTEAKRKSTHTPYVSFSGKPGIAHYEEFDRIVTAQ